MPSNSRRLCDCDDCTGDGGEPPCLVSRTTWFEHQASKRCRLSVGSVTGGGPSGTAGSATGSDRDEPPAGLAGDEVGDDVGGEAETVDEDCPSGPDHTAEGGAAACSEDSPLSADQDVGQAGEDESSEASSDAESDDSTNVPPTAFIRERRQVKCGSAAWIEDTFRAT